MTDQVAIAAIRFGYGLPLPAGAPTDPSAMLAALRAPDAMAAQYPTAGLAAVSAALVEELAQRPQRRGTDAERKPYQAAMATIADQTNGGVRAGFVRALAAPDGFRERLVNFWTDHFTVIAKTSAGESMPHTLIDEAIRPNLAGPFAQMLRAVTFHPAMLIYLNQVASVGPDSAVGKKQQIGLNENLARELMELHTLGVGAPYSQTDVTQMANLLTGLWYAPKAGFRFAANRAEPGVKTVLGKTYSGSGLDPVAAALTDLALHPETAHHLSRELAVHFLSDTPDEAVVSLMAQSYLDSGGDLSAVYATLLAQPAAWAPLGAKARQPYDFMVASLRALGVSPADLAGYDLQKFNHLIILPMRAMGQKWTKPRGPDGWAEAASAWITPPALAARITWAMNIPLRLVKPLPEPVAFLDQTLGPVAGAPLRWATARAADFREGVGLVLASAEFNTR